MPFLDTPHIDPLPPYSPRHTSQARDSETASIRSSAPSYHSEPPAYEQVVYQPSSNTSSSGRHLAGQQQGLPRLHYAPGFVPRPSNPFSSSNYSFVSWSTTQRNPRRKHYENVARRRVQENDLIDTLAVHIANIVGPQRLTERQVDNMLSSSSEATEAPRATEAAPRAPTASAAYASLRSPSMLDVTTPAVLPTTQTEATPSSQRSSAAIAPENAPLDSVIESISVSTLTAPLTTTAPPPLTGPSFYDFAPPNAPVHPHEDPDLVGPVAAERTRSQRLYREAMLYNPQLAMQQESASWDFMLAQSSDWQERQQKWRQFREYREWGWKGVGKRFAGIGRG